MMKTIQITIDEPLLERLDCLLEKQHAPRSAFIREAVERELHRLEIAAAEEQWRAAYATGGSDDDALLSGLDWGPDWEA
ncbi:MAG: ribbon-helix-helix domain-containing protein [Dehalococcoidia bacterium]